MKSTALIAFFLILGIISCSDKLRSLDDTATEVNSVNGEEISFSKNINYSGDIFSIAVGGLGSIRYLDIRKSRDGVMLVKYNDELEGMIYGAMVNDLNANDKPEVLLIVLKNGIAGSAYIVGFELNGKQFKRFELPQPQDDLSYGYEGKDHFYISKSQLFHEFPIFSGSPVRTETGKRRLVYSLSKDLNFKLEKFEDLK